MPVPSAITDLSTTASSNSPAGSETPADGDNYLRAHAAFIAQLNANKLDKAGTVTPTANQPMGGFKFTGAGNATSNGEFVTYDKAKSGTYTPVSTNDSNLSGLTFLTAHWTRVGDVVTVSGTFEADAVSAGVTSFEMSLPVASNFVSTANAAGGAWCDGAERSFRVSANVANDRAYFLATLQNTTVQSFGYSFSYQVL